MAQSGEYVVRKEAVDKLGTDFMDMINNADRLGYMGGGLVPRGQNAHSAIDELLAINTLNNQHSIEKTRQSAMMQDGGTVSFGGSQSELPTLEELYSMAGIMPVGAQKEAFEKAFTYDPSRESSTVAGYFDTVGDLTASGQGQVGRASEQMRQSQVAGGFAGSGTGSNVLRGMRTDAERGVRSGVRDAQRRMFESIRGDRESYIQAALAELQRLEGLGGTQEYRSGVQTREIGLGSMGAPSQPPQGSETGENVIGVQEKGTDGQTYEWNGSVWVLVTGGSGSGSGAGADLGGDEIGGGYGSSPGMFP